MYFILLTWYRRMRKDSYFTVQRRIVDFIILPVALVILFVGMRGGIQLRALRPAMAFYSPDFFLGHVASNSAFNLLKSLGDSGAEKLAYMDETKSIEIVRKKISGGHDGAFISKNYPLVRKTAFSDSTKKYNIV